MKIITEIDARNFEFWSGGKDTAKELTWDDWDVIEPMLDDLFPDGCTDTELNDFFWFETDTIAEWLGYENYDHMYSVRSGAAYESVDEAQEDLEEVGFDTDWLSDWLADEWDDLKSLNKEDVEQRCKEAHQAYLRELADEDDDDDEE